MLIFQKIVLIILVLFLVSCTPSLVYSPSINLPPKPLEKGKFQVMGGIGYLPESRPHKVKHKTAFGGEATIRYAICNHFSLQGKAWKDFSDNLDIERTGLSLSTIAMLNDSSNIRYGIIPTAAFLFDDEGLEGGGGGLPMGIWYTKFSSIGFYAALGPAFGIRDLSKEKKEWGWGVILNIGTSLILLDHLTINLELSGIKQINKYDQKNNYIISPSLNIGYLF